MSENAMPGRFDAERGKTVMAAVRRSLGGAPKKALVETYGCQQNVSDSQKIAGMLCEMGFSMTQSREDADIIIFNTCAVREHAELRVFGNIGALAPLKRKRPGLMIGVCGCMAQQEHIAQKIKEKFRHVDLIFGTHALGRFPEILSEALEKRETVVDISEQSEIAEGLPTLYDGGAKAFVSVMYGCDNFCSYCVVPYVRGRERSRAKADVLREVKSLAENGVREIMLLGQNVNSYGKDLGMTEGFANLVRAVSDTEGIKRIRFMSSHPKDISEDLLRAMAGCENVCKQLHLPIQSGSDEVLRAMNRGYTREKYLRIIDRARELMPGVALSTDIIVGFPGETEKDFADTCDILRTVRYDGIFSFIYSKRENTRAAKMENQVGEDAKKRRFSEMSDIQNAISLEINQRCVGSVQEVLVEGESKTDPEVMCGRNFANKTVNFKGGGALTGQFARVKITRARTWALWGELAGE